MVLLSDKTQGHFFGCFKNLWSMEPVLMEWEILDDESKQDVQHLNI